MTNSVGSELNNKIIPHFIKQFAGAWAGQKRARYFILADILVFMKGREVLEVKRKPQERGDKERDLRRNVQRDLRIRGTKGKFENNVYILKSGTLCWHAKGFT